MGAQSALIPNPLFTRRRREAYVGPRERIEQTILVIRSQRVMLDTDVAVLYGVSVGRLNEAVKRNVDRFPEDFMFQLTKAELENLKSQIAISFPPFSYQFSVLDPLLSFLCPHPITQHSGLALPRSSQPSACLAAIGGSPSVIQHSTFGAWPGHSARSEPSALRT